MRDVRNLQGRVVLVVGAERGMGAAVAIGLAARGAAVVVTGENERRLGEIVGEIAYGGGKARHVVHALTEADLGGSAESVLPGVRRALDTFGGLDVAVVVASPQDLRGGLLRAAIPRIASSLPDEGVVLVLGDAASRDELASVCRESARALVEHRIACNAVVQGAAFDDDRDEGALVDLVLFLTSASGRAVSGQTIAVREL